MRPWDEGVRVQMEQVTPPTEEPLKLAFVRDKHLRLVSVTTEDDYIQRLIKVTRIEGERVTRRAWMPQTWRQVLDRFPCGREIEIEMPPLLSIDSITYIDANGDEQTLDPTVYQVSAPQGPRATRGRVALAYAQVWPVTRCETIAAVSIEFTCGYQDNASPPSPNVPEDLTQGMLLAIGEFYKQRSESIAGLTNEKAYRTAKAIWTAYRVY